MVFASIREHAEHYDFFASTSKSSKGKILRAVKNFNGPFITPFINASNHSI